MGFQSRYPYLPVIFSFDRLGWPPSVPVCSIRKTPHCHETRGLTLGNRAVTVFRKHVTVKKYRYLPAVLLLITVFLTYFPKKKKKKIALRRVYRTFFHPNALKHCQNSVIAGKPYRFVTLGCFENDVPVTDDSNPPCRLTFLVGTAGKEKRPPHPTRRVRWPYPIWVRANGCVRLTEMVKRGIASTETTDRGWCSDPGGDLS